MINIGGILNTDFGTLANDGKDTATVTIGALQTIAGSAQTSWTADVVVGLPQSLLNVKVNSSLEPTRWYVMRAGMIFDRIGSTTGIPSAPYSVLITVAHLTGSTVRVLATIQNPYSTTLQLSATTEWFDFSIRPYIAPF